MPACSRSTWATTLEIEGLPLVAADYSTEFAIRYDEPLMVEKTPERICKKCRAALKRMYLKPVEESSTCKGE